MNPKHPIRLTPLGKALAGFLGSLGLFLAMAGLEGLSVLLTS